MTKAGIYVHFPFCKLKCMYCDFYSVAERNDDIPKFVNALIREIELCEVETSSWELDTVFIGGGTPGLMDPKYLEAMLNMLHQKFDLSKVTEWTMEVNPGEAPLARIEAFRSLGINRLSIGVQSLEPELLTFLTRIHSAEDAIKTFKLARKAGFENINCDLIFNIPGQAVAIWQRDIKKIIDLEPEHISAYSLTVESGTALSKLVLQNKVTLPGDDHSADLYQWTQQFLQQYGYEHYEISNWAKPGKECKHNLHYWMIEPYLAFGPSAHGFDGNIRYNNVRNLDAYFRMLDKDTLPIENQYIVSDKDMINDRIGFGIRTAFGIDLNHIPLNHKITIQEKWAPFILKENHHLKLTKEGFLFADAIAVDLMIE